MAVALNEAVELLKHYDGISISSNITNLHVSVESRRHNTFNVIDRPVLPQVGTRRFVNFRITIDTSRMDDLECDMLLHDILPSSRYSGHIEVASSDEVHSFLDNFWSSDYVLGTEYGDQLLEMTPLRYKLNTEMEFVRWVIMGSGLADNGNIIFTFYSVPALLNRIIRL